MWTFLCRRRMLAQTPSTAVLQGRFALILLLPFCCWDRSGPFRSLRLTSTHPFRMVCSVGATLSSSSVTASHEKPPSASIEDCRKIELVFFAHKVVISFWMSFAKIDSTLLRILGSRTACLPIVERFFVATPLANCLSPEDFGIG